MEGIAWLLNKFSQNIFIPFFPSHQKLFLFFFPTKDVIQVCFGVLFFLFVFVCVFFYFFYFMASMPWGNLVILLVLKDCVACKQMSVKYIKFILDSGSHSLLIYFSVLIEVSGCSKLIC